MGKQALGTYALLVLTFASLYMYIVLCRSRLRLVLATAGLPVVLLMSQDPPAQVIHVNPSNSNGYMHYCAARCDPAQQIVKPNSTGPRDLPLPDDQMDIPKYTEQETKNLQKLGTYVTPIKQEPIVQ